MAHIHFTSTATARARVISMGEKPWRVHHAGAPLLDHLQRRALLSREELERSLNIDLSVPTAVVAYHPVTLLEDTLSEADELFAALQSLPMQLLFCYPNADAGSRELVARTQQFLRQRGSGKVFVNLAPSDYWSLLGSVSLLVGNSSSGIMESGSFALPTVDIGLRQHGRERGPNILHAASDRASITAALQHATSHVFRQQLTGMSNLYGDGHVSERILAVLADLPSRDKLLSKIPAELPA
jgi:UDP-N-acetylglucosamine 2-epimerase (non-hydrolysing)/GDP/UDP-N,N'-diacetylbacillosamine 2-epimerase (hydrolysing)